MSEHHEPPNHGEQAGAHGETGATRRSPASEGPRSAAPPARSLRVLVYSDDPQSREQVRLALGRHPAADLPAVEYLECSRADEVVDAADAGGLDLLVLDGEATPTGGIGLARQLKYELRRCPPILIVVGRRDDRWLATWSMADAVVAHPLDPFALTEAAAGLLRSARARQAAIRAR